jgi:hypothetical protein
MHERVEEKWHYRRFIQDPEMLHDGANRSQIICNFVDIFSSFVKQNSNMAAVQNDSLVCWLMTTSELLEAGI